MSFNSTTTSCSVAECKTVAHMRGWCYKHYSRWRRRRTFELLTTEERFWAKVNFDGPPWNGTPCWEWTASLTKGYGRFVINGRRQMAHRVAYEWLRGPIPDGLTIDHLCRNTICMNHVHLEPVTMKVNLARGFSPYAVNGRKTHCPAGHSYTENNTTRWRGRRICRKCRRIQQRRYRRKKTLEGMANGY
jgi:hypothetical protein